MDKTESIRNMEDRGDDDDENNEEKKIIASRKQFKEHKNNESNIQS